jgi:hypothetical protein
MIAKLQLDLAEDAHPSSPSQKGWRLARGNGFGRCQSRASRNCVREQSVESPPTLCYRHRGTMKTNLKTGRRRQHSGKPHLGVPRSLRRASAPHPSALATGHLSLVRFQKMGSSGPLPTKFLIANPELEFSSSHRKHSPLRISNRKFSRVFHPDLAPNFLLARRSSLFTPHQGLSVALLIYGTAIRNLRK